MADPAVLIRRPLAAEWERVMEILAACNFQPIGGAEMREFPPGDCFVAVLDGMVVGVGGYRIVDGQTARTTLLAVDPEFRSGGIGGRLQQARQDFLKSRGIKTLYTNVDDDRVVRWYEREFGYVATGRRIKKLEPFGRDDRHEWINLKVEL